MRATTKDKNNKSDEIIRGVSKCQRASWGGGSVGIDQIKTTEKQPNTKQTIELFSFDSGLCVLSCSIFGLVLALIIHCGVLVLLVL